MDNAIAHCAAAGKGIYAMKALAGGNFISDARNKFRYVLNLEGVHGVAVGMLSKEEIDGNALISGVPIEIQSGRELRLRITPGR